MPTLTENTHSLLRLTMAPGLGPRRIASMVELFGSATAALAASPAEMARIRGIGTITAAKIARGLRESMELAEREIEHAERLGVIFLGIGEPGYPPLLATIPDPPPILSVLGELRPETDDRYPAAIVGSRACTSYGLEQAERFASILAGSGITIVSGGARGIDSAAHRGAMRSNGRTIAVLGCGLAHRYPPENAALFEEIADGRGALVSELPLDVSPQADNFPARNRIISGLALGVVVIEAAKGSGALITARAAAEDQGREVLAVPGRVDSPASEGTHTLIKAGGAALATGPGDVLELLETPARHHFVGTHEPRYADATATEPVGLWAGEGEPTTNHSQPTPSDPLQKRLLDILDRARTPDDLATRLGVGPAEVRTAITMLEIQGLIGRRGSLIERRQR
ncbi:Rossmann fold nucleotide-binding protein Smf possibly involved in DNA uptake [hydrothermal vent metagenome]|uniref:Rossmann fold nucleotide-binding protein Smf possibly involved in DNA uptake n=1 Tax=hydrothermal vent metagenome TaxID=652676 RepID=A0A3B1DE59_9ZZZZ